MNPSAKERAAQDNELRRRLEGERASERKSAEHRVRRFRDRLRRRRTYAWSPWLVIRADEMDAGFRPLPAGTNYWNSPDVWSVDAEVFGPGEPHVARVGMPHIVRARVINLGTARALPVLIRFWTGVTPGPTPDAVTLLGRVATDVPRHSAAEIDCPVPWIPAEPGVSEATESRLGFLLATELSRRFSRPLTATSGRGLSV